MWEDEERVGGYCLRAKEEGRSYQWEEGREDEKRGQGERREREKGRMGTEKRTAGSAGRRR